MFKLLKSLTHFPRVSTSRACLIKADGLIEHGYFRDALIEAEKARDAKDANAYEVKIAKGKMLEVFQLMKNEKVTPKL